MPLTHLLCLQCNPPVPLLQCFSALLHSIKYHFISVDLFSVSTTTSMRTLSDKGTPLGVAQATQELLRSHSLPQELVHKSSSHSPTTADGAPTTDQWPRHPMLTTPDANMRQPELVTGFRMPSLVAAAFALVALAYVYIRKVKASHAAVASRRYANFQNDLESAAGPPAKGRAAVGWPLLSSVVKANRAAGLPQGHFFRPSMARRSLRMYAAPDADPNYFPTKEEVLQYLASCEEPPNQALVVRDFGMKNSPNKDQLLDILRELKAEAYPFARRPQPWGDAVQVDIRDGEAEEGASDWAADAAGEALDVPTRDSVLEYLAKQYGPVPKAQVLRDFGVANPQSCAQLLLLLCALERDGCQFARAPPKKRKRKVPVEDDAPGAWSAGGGEQELPRFSPKSGRGGEWNWGDWDQEEEEEAPEGGRYGAAGSTGPWQEDDEEDGDEEGYGDGGRRLGTQLPIPAEYIDWSTEEEDEEEETTGIFKFVERGDDGYWYAKKVSSLSDPNAPRFAVSGSRTLDRRMKGQTFQGTVLGERRVRLLLFVHQLFPLPDQKPVLGVVLSEKGQTVFQAQDKKLWQSLRIASDDPKQYLGHYVEVTVWDAVRSRTAPSRRSVVDVVQDLGPVDGVSEFIITLHGFREHFPKAAVALAEDGAVPPLGDRTEMRHIPFVTIDGADAKDFDDAVFAEPDPDPENPGGWHLVVAIADVAHYVKPGDALDVEALTRGNSIYLPDRCLPMLPERLSNGLCSLRPNEDRACLGVHMYIDKDGEKFRHEFFRGLMRSVARLTYAQVESIIDGEPSDLPPSVLDRVDNLLNAYRSLKVARLERDPLAIVNPELKVDFGPNGEVVAISNRRSLESNQLIEEYMVLANRCAAEFLQDQELPCVYRVHEEPDETKIKGLKEFFFSRGMRARGAFDSTAAFNRILEAVPAEGASCIVHDMVLRSQAKARYCEENFGHFGLNLKDYCHFTSPIRRYADLMIHRLLLDALEGTHHRERIQEHMVEVCEHISQTEQDSMWAEREAIERFASLFFRSQVGSEFPGYISGVSRAGLFVTFGEVNFSGLIPMDRLMGDFFEEREAPIRLVGKFSGVNFVLGDPIVIMLEGVDVAKGKMKLALSKALQEQMKEALEEARVSGRLRSGRPSGGSGARRGRARGMRQGGRPGGPQVGLRRRRRPRAE